MSGFEFLRPKLDGPRFKDHTIPLDILKDLSVLEEFVISVAKAEWLRDNPGRQRTARDFMSGVEVRLQQVEKGSAIPVLTAFLAMAKALLPGAVSVQQEYLEKARERIVAAVAAAEAGGNPADYLPGKSLAYFDRFGRSLRDGESMSFVREGGLPPARLTPQTRRRLLLAAPGVDFIIDEAVRRGVVVNTNDDDGQFSIRLANGEVVNAPLSPEHREAVLDAQKDSPSGVRVAVRGIGRFNRTNKLIDFADVDDVTPLDPLDVPARLDGLRLLKTGWLNGEGWAPDATALDKLGQLFTTHYRTDLPLPYTFPTIDGGVQFEWRLNGSAPEVEIDLSTFRGEWLSEDDEAILELSVAQGWADLADRLSARITPNQNEEAD